MDLPDSAPIFFVDPRTAYVQRYLSRGGTVYSAASRLSS
jgi:hypothetical protein